MQPPSRAASFDSRLNVPSDLSRQSSMEGTGKWQSLRDTMTLLSAAEEDGKSKTELTEVTEDDVITAFRQAPHLKPVDAEAQKRREALKRALRKVKEMEELVQDYNARSAEMRDRCMQAERRYDDICMKVDASRSGPARETLLLLNEKKKAVLRREELKKEAQKMLEEYSLEKSKLELDEEERGQYRALLAIKALSKASEGDTIDKAKSRGLQAIKEARAQRIHERMTEEKHIEDNVRQKLENAQYLSLLEREELQSIKNEIKEVQRVLDEVEAGLASADTPAQKMSLLQIKLLHTERLQKLQELLDARASSWESRQPVFDGAEQRALRGLQAVQRLKEEREEMEKMRKQEEERRKVAGKYKYHGIDAATLRLARDKREFSVQAKVHYKRELRQLQAMRRDAKKTKDDITAKLEKAKSMDPGHTKWSYMHSLMEKKLAAVSQIQSLDEEIQALAEENKKDEQLAELTLAEKEVLRSAEVRLTGDRPASREQRRGSLVVPSSPRLAASQRRSSVAGPSSPRMAPAQVPRRQSLSGVASPQANPASSGSTSSPAAELLGDNTALRKPVRVHQNNQDALERLQKLASRVNLTSGGSGGGGRPSLKRSNSIRQLMELGVITEETTTTPTVEDPKEVLPLEVFVRFRQALHEAVMEGKAYDFDLDSEKELVKRMKEEADNEEKAALHDALNNFHFGESSPLEVTYRRLNMSTTMDTKRAPKLTFESEEHEIQTLLMSFSSSPFTPAADTVDAADEREEEEEGGGEDATFVTNPSLPRKGSTVDIFRGSLRRLGGVKKRKSVELRAPLVLAKERWFRTRKFYQSLEPAEEDLAGRPRHAVVVEPFSVGRKTSSHHRPSRDSSLLHTPTRQSLTTPGHDFLDIPDASPRSARSSDSPSLPRAASHTRRWLEETTVPPSTDDLRSDFSSTFMHSLLDTVITPADCEVQSTPSSGTVSFASGEEERAEEEEAEEESAATFELTPVAEEPIVPQPSSTTAGTSVPPLGPRPATAPSHGKAPSAKEEAAKKKKSVLRQWKPGMMSPRRRHESPWATKLPTSILRPRSAQDGRPGSRGQQHNTRHPVARHPSFRPTSAGPPGPPLAPRWSMAA